MQWRKQTLFKGWPKDCFIFHAPLFVKSTEPTSIFKLGVKETGQSALTISTWNVCEYLYVNFHQFDLVCGPIFEIRCFVQVTAASGSRLRYTRP